MVSYWVILSNLLAVTEITTVVHVCVLQLIIMTVQYISVLATSRFFGMLKLLFRLPILLIYFY